MSPQIEAHPNRAPSLCLLVVLRNQERAGKPATTGSCLDGSSLLRPPRRGWVGLAGLLPPLPPPPPLPLLPFAAMENGGQVYGETTVPAEPAPAKNPFWRGDTFAHLGWHRFTLKLLQLVLSFLAFVLEEVVSQCTQCAGLYFFEFVSCIAFLLCLPILFIYCTSLYEKIGKEMLIKPEMCILPAVGVFFFIASIVFSATSDKTSVEKAAIAFGFLASFAFLVEAGLLIFKQRKTQEERQAENTANTVNATENQPLNNQQA